MTGIFSNDFLSYSIDPGSSFNGCNGSYIDMKESIKRNLNHINSTQRKNLIRMSSMSWWDNVSSEFFVSTYLCVSMINMF